MPLVSVIIPSYNHAQFLEKRFFSVVNQTFENFEVIILDDCSTDKSRDIIEKYRSHPKVKKIIYNNVNEQSPYKQWKKGVENSNGELIWIAESDDWSEIIFLEKVVPFFCDQNISMVISSGRMIFDELDNFHVDICFNAQKDDGIDFIKSNMLGHCGIKNVNMIVFRKEIFLNYVNGDWIKYKQAGDWRLYIDLIFGYKVVTLDEILSYCRIHKSNLTSLNRKKGLDFLEGLEIYKYSRTLCGMNFNKKIVYDQWFNNYLIISGYFEKGIRLKVFLKIISTDFNLFFYVVYNYFIFKVQRKIKKIIKNNS